MDKLSDVRQVKLVTVEAAAKIVAENLGKFTSAPMTGSADANLKAAAEATRKLALELEKHVWSSGQVGGGR